MSTEWGREEGDREGVGVVSTNSRVREYYITAQ